MALSPTSLSRQQILLERPLDDMSIRIGIVGAGKMGLSHFAIANALPGATVVAVCDTSRYVLSVLRKYTGVATYTAYEDMIDEARLDCVIIATPSATHFECARYALERNLHLFVEKPLTLSPNESRALADLATQRQRVNQVGFHYRFLGTFQEARRLVRTGAIGTVASIHGTAVGQVVLQGQNSTWRARRIEGGGCLHDYACHVVDLMNFLVGPPSRVESARMQTIFSNDVEDTVSAVFAYRNGMTGSLETNWSDETVRKMTTTVTIHGTEGTLVADRQELKVQLSRGRSFEDYQEGGNTRSITGLQKPVRFYLRGEEYTAQIDAFFEAVRSGDLAHENSFASACEADRVLDLIIHADRERRH